MATQVIVNGITLSDASWANDADLAAYAHFTGVAGTNTLTATGSANFAYNTGAFGRFIPVATNTSTVTLNVTPSGAAALGAKNVFYNGSACVAGELRAKVPVAVEYDGTQFNILSNGALNFVPKHIAGLTYSNNGSDATNDLDIAAGSCRDSTNAVDMVLGATLTKQSDVVWAVGSGNGGLDTGAVGNSDYYIWLIKRSDTGVVDALYSLSSTAPTMPTSYDYKRLIGWFKRTGGATIVAFHTYELDGGGLELRWDALTQDIALSNTLTTARRTDAVKVPLNFSTLAILSVQCSDATTNFNANICCPDQTDGAVDPERQPYRAISRRPILPSERRWKCGSGRARRGPLPRGRTWRRSIPTSSSRSAFAGREGIERP
jgi:hypothetical protein